MPQSCGEEFPVFFLDHYVSLRTSFEERINWTEEWKFNTPMISIFQVSKVTT